MAKLIQSVHLRRFDHLPASIRSSVGICCWMLVHVMAADSVRGQRAAEQIDWYTGSAFRRQLQEPVGITWSEMPLRTGLQNLARSQRLAIFLDRRVDPEQLISFSCDNQPLSRALHEMARPAQLGVGFVGPVIYIGPPLTSARIATLAERRNEQVKTQPDAAQHRLLERTPLSWPDLTEPRLIFARTASEIGMTVPNIRSIPHDLWFAADLPPMTFAEKATLLAAGFDMSFKMDKTKVLLTRFPRAVGLVRDYRTGDPQRLATLLQEEFPQAFVAVDESRKSVRVRSLLEDHWQIDRIRSGKRAPSTPSDKPAIGNQRFTMTIDNKPVGPVLQMLAKKLEMQVEFADDIPQAELQTLVSASVQEVTAEELLSAVAAPAGLSVSIHANVFRVKTK